MSEKRPDSGLDEEMKRKLKLGGSASGSVANPETLKPALKPPTGKRNQEKEMKKKVRSDLPLPASVSVADQETLKPPMEKRNQAANQVTLKPALKPPTGKRTQDKEMKRKVRFDQSASGSVAKQETLKVPKGKRNQVGEGSSKAQTGGKSRSSPRISRNHKPTIIYQKRLTYDDVFTGKLDVPAALFLGKKRPGKHDRIMIPFLDNKGEIWEFEATPKGLSFNWYKFVTEHGLKYNDMICFIEDDPNSNYYILQYERFVPVPARDV